jgi:hypothetical protein
LKTWFKFYERTYRVFLYIYMYKFELVFMTISYSCENLRSFSILFSHVKVSIDSQCVNQVEI